MLSKPGEQGGKEKAVSQSQAMLEIRHAAVDAAGSRAVADANLRLDRGEFHALLGERGSGKTALARAMTGMTRLRKGEVLLHGQPLRPGRPRQALRRGLYRVPQGGSLIEDWTVLDNLLLLGGRRARPFVSRKRTEGEARRLMAAYGLEVDLRAAIKTLDVFGRLRAEWLKALYRDAEVLVVDEITGLLPVQAADEMLAFLKKLAENGKTVLLLTHRIREALAADACTVLRAGKTVIPQDRSEAALRRLMSGDAPPLLKRDMAPGSMLLEARGLMIRSQKGRRERLKDVSFEVRAGEIVGVTGLAGSGLTALAAAVLGNAPLDRGRIRFMSRNVSRDPAAVHAEAGMGYLPPPGLSAFLPGDMTVTQALLMRRQREKAFQDGGFFRVRQAEIYAEDLLDSRDIDADILPETPMETLTAEDRQIIFAAREAEKGNDLLVAEQPTLGLDQASARRVDGMLLSLRENRKSVLLLSRDTEEIMALSDRILVMCRGEIVGEFDPRLTSEKELGLYMLGGLRQEKFGGRMDEEDEDA